MKIVTRRVQICFENMIVDQEARRGVQGRAGNYEYECWSKYADIIIFIFIRSNTTKPGSTIGNIISCV